MLGIRLIAVNDGYDNINLTASERLVSGLKNLVNDIYAKDISRKVSAALHIKQKQGAYIGSYAPYGYAGVIIGTSQKKPVNMGFSPIIPSLPPRIRREKWKELPQGRSESASFFYLT
jgi:hypothetical protein